MLWENRFQTNSQERKSDKFLSFRPELLQDFTHFNKQEDFQNIDC